MYRVGESWNIRHFFSFRMLVFVNVLLIPILLSMVLITVFTMFILTHFYLNYIHTRLDFLTKIQFFL